MARRARSAERRVGHLDGDRETTLRDAVARKKYCCFGLGALSTQPTTGVRFELFFSVSFSAVVVYLINAKNEI